MGGKQKPSWGLGKAIGNAQKKAKEENVALHFTGKRTFLEGKEHGVSCLESTNLDDFLAKAELANAEFEAIRGRFSLVDKTIVTAKEKQLGMDRKMAEIKGVVIPIPRRPVWDVSIDGERLQQLENEAFLHWRKKLAKLEEQHGFVMTPFERNLDFWRQLWRVCEKSDLVCTICDCRDPLFYRSVDLERYVKELGGEAEREEEVESEKPDRHEDDARSDTSDPFRIKWGAKLDSDAEEEEGSEENDASDVDGDESGSDDGDGGGSDGGNSIKDALQAAAFQQNVDEFAELNQMMLSNSATGKAANGAAASQFTKEQIEFFERKTSKKTLLILNKADYMAPELRKKWRAFFDARSIEVAFFSAKYELEKLGIDIDLPTDVLDAGGAGAGGTTDETAGAGENADPTVANKSSRRRKEQPAKERPKHVQEEFNRRRVGMRNKTDEASGGFSLNDAEPSYHQRERRRKGPKNTAGGGPLDPAAALSGSRQVVAARVQAQLHAKKSVFQMSLASLSTDDEDEAAGEVDAPAPGEDDEAVEETEDEAEAAAEATSTRDQGATEDAEQQQGFAQDGTVSRPAPANEECLLADASAIHDSRDDDDILDCDGLMRFLVSKLPGETKDLKPVVGFCGYPNVGKSSIINALFGSKKVSMSRQPGKTKHFQTLESDAFTLCDCPGLVFPSIVATKAHLVINSVMPIDQLRSEYMAPIALVVDKVGTKHLYQHYKVEPLAVKQDPATRFLMSFATARRHFLRDLVPDTTWAAQRLLKDFTTGVLLHCESPPVADGEIKAISSGGDMMLGSSTAEEQLCGERTLQLPSVDEEEEFDEEEDGSENAGIQLQSAENQLTENADCEFADEEGNLVYVEPKETTKDVKKYDAFDDWNPASLEEMLTGVAAKQVTKRQTRRDAKMAQKGNPEGKREGGTKAHCTAEAFV
eukprot:g1025.t1